MVRAGICELFWGAAINLIWSGIKLAKIQAFDTRFFIFRYQIEEIPSKWEKSWLKRAEIGEF